MLTAPVGYRQRHRIPDLGVGVGFRPKHAEHVLEHGAGTVEWFEIVTENYLVDGGRTVRNLERLRAAHRVVPHGVSMSIGGPEPLDEEYLGALRRLLDRVAPPWFSDHLCWTGAAGLDLHELLPLPHTPAVVRHVVERVRQVQDAVGRPFALENVSSYLTYKSSEMPEWELLAEIAERADCGILFDVNNVYVSARNHGFDANAYVDAIPPDRVVQVHLAGHTDKGTHLLDTHSAHVADPVWDLYVRAIRRMGAVSTLIEWDENIPEWSVLEEEASRARRLRARALEEAA
jgi:uncharacterized protein (UPF0276 family)